MALIHASIRRAAGLVGRAIVDTVYPRICAGCGMRGYWLCEYCEEETLLLNLPDACGRCGEPVLDSGCGCRDLPQVITRARAIAVYDGWAANAVRRTKYDGEWDRAGHLGSLMIDALGAFGPVDGLVPVPLHPSRQATRGYNQAQLLARHLSDGSGIPVMDVLRRTRNTVSQTTLSGRERRENVEKVFVLDPDWYPHQGRCYVLVDDVRTTGATLGACAEALSAANPAMIGVLTFALDMQRDEITAYREMVRQAKLGATTSP